MLLICNLLIVTRLIVDCCDSFSVVLKLVLCNTTIVWALDGQVLINLPSSLAIGLLRSYLVKSINRLASVFLDHAYHLWHILGALKVTLRTLILFDVLIVQVSAGKGPYRLLLRDVKLLRALRLLMLHVWRKWPRALAHMVLYGILADLDMHFWDVDVL